MGKHYPSLAKMRPLAIRTMPEVAAIMGITKQAVRETEARALYKIRIALEEWYQERPKWN